jgi:hypothetical protein
MKTINVHARLGFAGSAVIALRVLRMVGKTMHYRDFATVIGLVRDGEHWSDQQDQQMRDILGLVAMAERHGGVHTSELPLDFQLVVPKGN